jgi:hypothetical protein
LDTAPGDLDLLCITKDFSHDGLYFLALNNQIRSKMQLLLKFPFLSDAGNIDRECLVEVVRTHDLFPGRFGVGVRLIGYRDPGNVETASVVIPSYTSVPKDISSFPIDFYA